MEDIKDEKIKMLIPTLRQKKRYFLIKIVSKKKFNFDTFSKFLNKEVLYFLGALDYSNCNFWILKDKFDYNSQTFIIRVSTKMIKKSTSLISLINKFEDFDIKLNIIKISSTLKKLIKN